MLVALTMAKNEQNILPFTLGHIRVNALIADQGSNDDSRAILKTASISTTVSDGSMRQVHGICTKLAPPSPKLRDAAAPNGPCPPQKRVPGGRYAMTQLT